MPDVFKDEAKKRMEAAALKTDLEIAVENKDKEEFKRLVGKGYTYEVALKAKGIERGDETYRHGLEYALMWLYEKRPFYCHMFADVVRIESFKLPTLGMCIRQARIELTYNPDFLALNNPQANAVALQHEMGHCIQGHPVLRHRLPPDVVKTWAYTVALELAVNSLIQDIVKQHPFTVMPGDLMPIDSGAPVKERKSWEYYYHLLKEYEPPPTMKLIMMGKGDEGGEDEERGQEDGDEDDGSGQNRGEMKALGVGQFDDHGGWDDSDNADIQEEVIKQAVSQAYRKAENTKSSMRGYMPDELIDRIEELLKDKSVPFERVFRSFVGGQIKVGRRPTIMRLSRRRRVPPGNTFTRALRIIWYQDDSGSMSNEEVALCRSELYHASQISGVMISFQRFCYGLVGEMVDLEHADFSEVMTRAIGGTDFGAVIEHAIEQRPDLIMIATDGHAPTPEKKPPCPMAWVLTSNGQSHPWGAIIRLPTIEEIKRGYKAAIERWTPNA